jgi:hypothetical protein
MKDGRRKVILGGKWERHTSQIMKKLIKPIKNGKALENDSEEVFNFEPY